DRPGDRWLSRDLATLARELHIPLASTNNVHYAAREAHRLQDILTCIRHNTTLDDAGSYLRPNSEYYLKSPAQMAALFADLPDAVANTRRIADRCDFELAFGLQELPVFSAPENLNADQYLVSL